MQVVFLLGFTSGIYALAGDPVTAIKEGDLIPVEECELLTIGLNQLPVQRVGEEAVSSTSRSNALRTWYAGFRQLLESQLKQDSELACLRKSSESWVTWWMIVFFQLTAILMINMLIAMMAKTCDPNPTTLPPCPYPTPTPTPNPNPNPNPNQAKTFDRIHSENATNFNFLRARVVSTWVTQHPRRRRSTSSL